MLKDLEYKNANLLCQFLRISRYKGASIAEYRQSQQLGSMPQTIHSTNLPSMVFVVAFKYNASVPSEIVSMTPLSKPTLTILYDGHCPICRREIVWLTSRNKQGQLAFQDVQQPGFDVSPLGVSLNDLLREIHGITSDKRLIKGIEVFSIAYAAAGLSWLAAPLRWRWTQPICQRLYRWFAEHRSQLAALIFGPVCRDGQCQR